MLYCFEYCTFSALSGICIASNGTCGKKGVPCKETFGSEWTVNGKCCRKRPCCKCQVCPEKFDLLPTQANGTHCYYYGDSRIQWDAAQSSCASTPGAYMGTPNTVQEANDVRDGLIFGSTVWTGATFRVKDGNYTFSIENGTSFVNSVPYGEGKFDLFMIVHQKYHDTWIRQ
ncbi:unnamed protein product [Mytilus edulis]|uniref:C-type lectin domain-containing protein n=1 Tax=Mytilus edulis TaxID=6550 RepID=A0A8S3S2X6_MYTED|nr:unnamed protein product [Mytilus edulis]